MTTHTYELTVEWTGNRGLGTTSYHRRTVGGDGGVERQQRPLPQRLLRPVVTIADPATTDAARQLHTIAHDKCFVANSVNFPVRHDDVILVQTL